MESFSSEQIVDQHLQDRIGFVPTLPDPDVKSVGDAKPETTSGSITGTQKTIGNELLAIHLNTLCCTVRRVGSRKKITATPINVQLHNDAHGEVRPSAPSSGSYFDL